VFILLFLVKVSKSAPHKKIMITGSPKRASGNIKYLTIKDKDFEQGVDYIIFGKSVEIYIPIISTLNGNSRQRGCDKSTKLLL